MLGHKGVVDDLQAVTEKLSAHVLENYDKFVAGVNEVVCVEQDLQVIYPCGSHGSGIAHGFAQGMMTVLAAFCVSINGTA